MRLLLIILLVLPFSAAFAYDLELTVNASPVFNLSQSTTYKLIVTNLDGKPPEPINLTITYWINDSTGNLSGYPKTTSSTINTSATIDRTWKPQDSGNYSICGNITSSTANDTNPANDVACKNVLVNGSSQAEDATLSVYLDSPAVMGVDYTSIFQIEIKNKADCSNQDSVAVNYNITKDGALVKDGSFARDVGCSGYANTGEWIPQAEGNYTICGMIESTTSDDENISNDAACGVIEVIDTSKIDCDLSIAINNTKLIYLSGESIDYDLTTNDAACSNFTHPYIVQYWIEDLFGNYLRIPYNSSGTLNCSDVKSPTKQAPSLCGSEVYVIKAAIAQPFCHDTNASNDAAEQMVIVKGSNPNSITCKSSSSSTSSSDSGFSTKEALKFAVKISSVPNQVHQGETVVTKFSLTNSYTTMKTFDIYSYAYAGQNIASEGGWTGNKISLQVSANDYVDASIINTIKQDAEPGKYSFRVRAAFGDDKADDTVDMEVLQGNSTLSSKSGEIVSFYTRTRNLIAGGKVKLYANIKNLQNQNQTFELKLDNETETITLEKKASKTYNFSVKLPSEDSVDYKLLLMQSSSIIDEKNQTLEIQENITAQPKANTSKSEPIVTTTSNVNWSSKSSFNVAAILFSFALLLLSLSLLATAVSSKRA